ncbi:MAG TPA: DUF4149 domain-containing protein [Ramlibacter sp.]|nr:DUF4149 domain-containing protein [Ramlibacter sp.]
MSWKSRVALPAAALWWGSLTMVGAVVVPLLFVHLPSPAMAGQMAAKLFTAQSWVSIGCGVLLMMSARATTEGSPMNWAEGALAFVFAGLLLAMLAEYAIAPRILARENLKVWHSVGVAMNVGQWVCAGVVLWRVAFPKSAAPS